MNDSTLRDFAVMYAWRFVGTPYEWGGDNPQGLDCSGFVGLVLRSVGLMKNREDLTAQGIYEKFKYKPQAGIVKHQGGCLVFYGRDLDHITHIAFMVDESHILEAGGGDSRTTTVQAADERNAFVRARPYDYRSDLIVVLDPFM